jgi:hypothetical protein
MRGVSERARGESSKTPEGSGLSRHINVFLEDATLWPLVFIFVVHVALAGALLLLAALRTGSPVALAVLALLLVLSGDAVRRARRRRRVALWLVTLWSLSFATAVGGGRLGLL